MGELVAIEEIAKKLPAAISMWNWFKTNLLGEDIHIVSPRPQEILENPENLGSKSAFRVRGTLKRLPKGHQIWLIVEDELTGNLWPQGFSSVQYDPVSGYWTGLVTGDGSTIKIVAVIAPPTSQDFFKYYQIVGDKTDSYHPLVRIPPECVKTTSVQARMPPHIRQ